MVRLSYPPSANRYYRSFRGRMVRSAAANAYRREVQQASEQIGMTLHHGPVKVSLELLPPTPKDWHKRVKKDGALAVLSVRRIDLDNALKVVLDALQGIAYENDRQITNLFVGLGTVTTDGGVEVTIEEDVTFAIP